MRDAAARIRRYRQQDALLTLTAYGPEMQREMGQTILHDNVGDLEALANMFAQRPNFETTNVRIEEVSEEDGDERDAKRHRMT